MPPQSLLDLDPEDPVGFEPAHELKEWILKTFIDEGGELHNPDHMHISPWDDDLFMVLWASTGFKKTEKIVLGQAEKFAPMAGG